MRRKNRLIPQVFGVAAAACAAALAASPALADKIKHPVAIFAGLDKITGRIISFEVSVDETVQFGSLHVTPRVCYTRPPTEAPHTTGFVEVEEVEKENAFKKIFSGWMFASSPGLSAAEHPVYDVWLTDCKGGKEIIQEARAVEDTPPDPNQALGSRPPVGGGAPAANAPAGERPQRPPQQRQALPRPGELPPPQGLPSPQGLPPPPQQAGRPVPPAPIPQQRVQEQRRSPVQSFFPTGPAPARPAQIFND